MAYGEPFTNAASAANFTDCVDAQLRAVLEALLGDDALKRGTLPSISELLALPYFASSTDTSTLNQPDAKSKLFASAKVKDSLEKAKAFIDGQIDTWAKVVRDNGIKAD